MARGPDPAPESVAGQVTGVIIAGGKGRRMGGIDKGLVPINGRPMVSYVIDAMQPQVASLLLNANRSHDRYRAFGFPVIADAENDFRGPLAGFASGMREAETPYIAVAPCDSPLLCGDMVQRLFSALQKEGARIAVAHDGSRLQPVFVLLDCTLLDALTDYVADGGRKIDHWYARQGYAVADCSDVTESFLNINAPDDQQMLENMLMQRSLT